MTAQDIDSIRKQVFDSIPRRWRIAYGELLAGKNPAIVAEDMKVTTHEIYRRCRRLNKRISRLNGKSIPWPWTLRTRRGPKSIAA